jgi:hypothetical protein
MDSGSMETSQIGATFEWNLDRVPQVGMAFEGDDAAEPEVTPANSSVRARVVTGVLVAAAVLTWCSVHVR